MPHNNLLRFRALPTCLRPPTWLLCLILALAMGAMLLPARRAAAIDESRLLATYARYRPGNLQPFRDWQAMLHDSQAAAAGDKLRRVNEFFNRRIQFGDD
ncbi:MAG TPA: hypothetical protein VJ652_03195, partial [Noviherbaspirillum sp.]|nr:hypothetical protein [Noviherbaspirillum sp.]